MERNSKVKKLDQLIGSVVEDTVDGVLLRAAPVFPPTTVDEVFGMIKYDGPTVTLEEMDAGVLAEAARRRARSRY